MLTCKRCGNAIKNVPVYLQKLDIWVCSTCAAKEETRACRDSDYKDGFTTKGKREVAA